MNPECYDEHAYRSDSLPVSVRAGNVKSYRQQVQTCGTGMLYPGPDMAPEICLPDRKRGLRMRAGEKNRICYFNGL